MREIRPISSGLLARDLPDILETMRMNQLELEHRVVDAERRLKNLEREIK